MDERHGTLVTTVPRAQVEEALHMDEPVDLLLDIERSTPGEGRETRRLALAWEREDLERMLENDGSEITLSFDEAELRQLLDDDVEAHGMREKLAVLTVVAAGIAAAGAGSALASPNSGDGSLAGGTAVPAATTQAPSSEISTGLGQQITAAQGRLVVPSEISTGLGATTAATATPVSASSPSWSPSPSEGAAIAIGALLAITAAGFAVRSRRTGGPTLAT